MSTIMVIAGGDWQIELIKKAKSMGHYVICSNLYKDSKGFKYADLGEVADVLDKQKNLEIAKKHSPDAVISDPVSYTHLDVYKRQSDWIIVLFKKEMKR